MCSECSTLLQVFVFKPFLDSYLLALGTSKSFLSCLWAVQIESAKTCANPTLVFPLSGGQSDVVALMSSSPRPGRAGLP
jgi:hypothetical protein